jgi:hypothetical protein
MGSGSDLLAGLLEGYNVTGVDYSTTMFNASRARLETFMSKNERVVSGALAMQATGSAGAADYLQQGLKEEQAAMAEEQEDIALRLRLINEHRDVMIKYAQSSTENTAQSGVMDIAYKLYLR